MEPLASGGKCYFTSLPMELHLRIRNELLRDPGIPEENKYYKSLRLVCKLFDLVWSPVLLVNFVFFPNGPNYPNHYLDLECLHRLVDGKSSLRTFNTVTLKNWHYLNTGFHYFFKMLMKLWVADWKMALLRIPPTLILAIPVNLVMFFGAPTRIVPRLQTFSTVLRARRYARKIPHKLQLPNVSCVRLILHPDDARWEVYSTTRFLAMAPNLTELVLRLSSDADMAYISKRLKSLRTLKKLTLHTYSPRPTSPPDPRSKPSFFSAVIARNPNLTHLGLMLSRHTRCDFSEMLRDIPDNKPLRLEHVALDSVCENIDALLPHIQPLTSLETQCDHMQNDTDIYNMLGQALVFPPTISADGLDQNLCKYLERHPGVSNLSIGHKDWPGTCHGDRKLSEIIKRHSGSLQKLRVRSHMLRSLNAEVALLKCVQLRELVLTRGDSSYNFPFGAAIFTNIILEDERHVLNIAARLSRSLTVVIEYRSALGAFVQYCRDSENPLLHDLAGRIVYEKPDEIPDLYGL